MAEYRYPLDIDYDRPMIGFFNQTGSDQIFTYMPQSMVFNDGGSYGTVDGGVMGTMAKQAIAARNTKGGAEELQSKAKENAMAAAGGNSAAVAALIAGMGQSIGIDGGFLGAAAAEGGIAMNPNTVVQFTNNEIRTYKFELQLVPESEAEAKEIKSIIGAFKYSMYAQKEGDFLLKYPDKWRIMFYADLSMPFYTGEVYLTSMASTYNTAGTMIHRGKTFNEVTISLDFQETKPMHRKDIKAMDGVS